MTPKGGPGAPTHVPIPQAEDVNTHPGPCWGLDRHGGPPWLKCENRHLGRLKDYHEVSEDGQVEPSVVCPQGCGWHQRIQLEDYPEDNHDA